MKRIAIVVSMAALVGCGGGGKSSGNGGNGGTTNTTLKVLASNVIFGTANANLSKVDLTGVDTEIKVLAENVVIDTSAGNALISDNLQDALNDELAVNLTTEIIGYWSVKNIEPSSTTMSVYCFIPDEHLANYNASGTVVFTSSGTYSVCSGRFAVAGLEFGDTRFIPTTYTIEDSGTLILNLTLNSATTAVPVIVSNLVDGSITMISSGGGCGEGIGMRYSKIPK